MKSEYSILSLLIPGPRSPGNDIDIYLKPLIDELKYCGILGLKHFMLQEIELFLPDHVAIPFICLSSFFCRLGKKNHIGGTGLLKS